ncbi:MAG: DNA polymerase III subunit beta [Candidatus Moranbacteria bacterium RIFOXYB1_FULL_44_23]|nr:MAG: DNA polymerase III subunit beta [Candidatus Moranbacteria bacterium RIFOXYB1_FULL_44_23]
MSENFKKGILIAEKIIGKNLTLPILSNILLEVEKSRLKVSATNLEIGVVCSLRAKIEKEGKIAVPGRIAGSYLSNIPDGSKMSIEAKNQTLYLTSEGSRAVIKGVDAKDFPIIPKPQSEHLFEIDGPVFQNKAAKVIASAAISETRQELTGVYFGFEKDGLVLAATDSFRLAEAKIKLEKNDIGANYQKFISKNSSIIVPAKTLQEVTRSISEESGRIKVYIGESQIFFEIDEVVFVSRLIDGKYPEYKQVIPKEFSSSVFVGRDDLVKAVRTASIFSDSKSREVKLCIKGDSGKMKIESQSVETGENIAEVPCQGKSKGENIIAFNNRYLVDALNSFSNNMVYIGFNDSFGPVIFREVLEKEKLDENYLHIIMPIRN